MKNNKGFTLVELISVISLLLVLSVLAVVAYSNITDAARKAAVSADANTVARALNAYNSIADVDTRITATPQANDEGVFVIAVKAGTNGPIDLDLSVVVPPERAEAIESNLVYSDRQGAVGMWTVKNPIEMP